MRKLTNKLAPFGKVRLSYYLSKCFGSDSTKRDLLLKQHAQAMTGSKAVDCHCGSTVAIHNAYRCLYCGLWFCAPCAEEHFGMSLDYYDRVKRIPEIQREAVAAFKQKSNNKERK